MKQITRPSPRKRRSKRRMEADTTGAQSVTETRGSDDQVCNDEGSCTESYFNHTDGNPHDGRTRKVLTDETEEGGDEFLFQYWRPKH
jgi:hypothetical protein